MGIGLIPLTGVSDGICNRRAAYAYPCTFMEHALVCTVMCQWYDGDFYICGQNDDLLLSAI